MTKKKAARQKLQKNAAAVDTSEEELNYKGKICLHVARALNLSRVKKNLKAGSISSCSNCTEEVESNDLPEIWLCLQCGNRGCGRMSTHRHALQHFKTIHSDCHALVLSSLSGVVWCYECDDKVNLQQSGKLRQCVEFLTKASGNKTINNTNKFSSTNQASLIETVLREQIVAKNADTNLKNSNKNKKDVPRLVTKGLRNLGNTCFFNAVMQNLYQTNLLYSFLEKACGTDYHWEVPRLTVTDGVDMEDPTNEILKLPIPRPCPLATSLLNFYKQMNAPPSIKNEIVNPSSLFSEISKKSAQFKHFQEQDSHELLRQLLDGIRQDEVKRQRKAILRNFGVSNVSLEELDDDTRKLIKAYSCYASHTLVEKIFGGVFISTVLCEECKMSSQVFEPFMDMSLPLFEEKQQDNCNQPYLEGGQQQDFKPLRGRKADIDEEGENVYVINKYKQQDPTKPSKHQERKLQKLTRKEKKKKFKVRKLSESNENPSEVPGDINNEDNLVNEEKGSDAINEKENCEMKCNGFDEDQVDDEHNISVSEPVELTNESSSCNNISTNVNREKEAEIDTTESIIGEEVTVKTETDVQANSNSDEKSDVCEKLVSHCINDNKQIQEQTTIDEFECMNLFGEDVYLDLKTDTISLEEYFNIDEQPMFEETNVEITSETKFTSPYIEQELESLTENLQNVKISSKLEPEERMQALGMQVKGIRIRCDSDRQDSLLDTSQSGNDEANLASSEYTCSDGEENWSRKLPEKQMKEWITKSLLTLQPRIHISPNECSIDSCLTYFTKPELLTGKNKFRCENCTELLIKKTGNKKEVAYSNASKQLLVFSPPAILTLHLKRFQQVGMALRKVNRFVEFPSILNMASYCSSACQILPHVTSATDEILYSLYGIVEHSGRLSTGHYTAYIKIAKRTLNENFLCHLPLAQCDLEQLLKKFSKISSEKHDNINTNAPEDYRWYYISDSQVREVEESRVLKCQAYLLFYERIK